MKDFHLFDFVSKIAQIIQSKGFIAFTSFLNFLIFCGSGMGKRCYVYETYYIETNCEFQHNYHRFSIILLWLRERRLVALVLSEAGVFQQVSVSSLFHPTVQFDRETTFSLSREVINEK